MFVSFVPSPFVELASHILRLLVPYYQLTGSDNVFADRGPTFDYISPGIINGLCQLMC